jgi:hypothetical protein
MPRIPTPNFCLRPRLGDQVADNTRLVKTAANDTGAAGVAEGA